MTFEEYAAHRSLPLVGKQTTLGRLFGLAVSYDKQGFVGPRDGWLKMIAYWAQERREEVTPGN